ncbi:MAG: general secretion pathway protein GspC [Deltaproteobacteria bacterium]|nr:general secretion pathway protein GspC [Deltaproteobacteria bacterium]
MARHLLSNVGGGAVDTYLKQYFWTFHLLVLGLAGFLVARAINVYVAKELAAPAAVLAAAQKSGNAADTETTRKSLVPTNAFLERNILSAEREDLAPPPPEAAEEEETADADNCNQKSSMRVTLVSTVVSTHVPSSVATFQDPQTQESITLRVGERLLNEATLMEVRWRKVKVDRSGHCEYFTIDNEALAGDTAVAPLPTPVVAQDDVKAMPDMKLGENIKKVGNDQYEIPRQEIDNVLSNLSVVATQARIVPSFQNGKPNGFKLFSIRPGSLYSKIGVMNGDVIQNINGYEMSSPDKALEIYSKLKDAQSVSVDLIRGGKTKTLTFNIR